MELCLVVLASYHIQGLRQKDCTFKPRLGLHKAHRELSSRLVLALKPKLEGQKGRKVGWGKHSL